ncbi:hypothetical protein XBP1_2040018 [Xenorhabdus bovienii str. puntauvense]|uniref:Uncharacterized protein n=3 Tax=Xenorhabdus bovienii TaxID=40576 RepID=A0A077NEK3_XENBV|nr:hypothetical protein XBFFR1_1550029 [Xenorhabdus bovienii str. feltiae France]CDG91106.1 hypothetical protein XBFFL1_1310001 [Xenorhabdus bovienii str. feltiae Florida]CDG96295.1 hypothetical protein XBP1_2040018 [Xenorhabdus bovienii str. puntauvense]CDH01907.1 hypothetical protein XBFM1_2390001 [Xenorhabdus bovienii str. feltiae Moldova]CDH24436.1 hypothetical protein XBKB1_2770018 [Xenorhabdus bovienii str. kraussei Becker Underwood]
MLKYGEMCDKSKSKNFISIMLIIMIEIGCLNYFKLHVLD